MSQPGANPFMDEDTRERFLTLLREGKAREAAAKAVGASYAQLRYYVMNHNPRFDTDIADSIAASRDEVVSEARRRALEGEGDIAWAGLFHRMTEKVAAPPPADRKVTLELTDGREVVGLKRTLEQRAIQEGEIDESDED